MTITKKPYYSSEIVPAKQLRSVTKSDIDPLPDGPCRSLYVGTGGDVAVIAESDPDDSTAYAQTFKNVPDGAYLYVCARWVLSTGTTASDIIANY